MPDDFDNFSLYVAILISGSLSVNPADVTVDSGATAAFAFMFKAGKPLATGFSVAWFSDSSRITESSGSGPSGPTFTPETPGDSMEAVSNPNSFHAGTLQVTAPTLPEGGENDPPVPYYGRMTLHQV